MGRDAMGALAEWDDAEWDVLVEHDAGRETDCNLGSVLAEREPSRPIAEQLDGRLASRAASRVTSQPGPPPCATKPSPARRLPLSAGPPLSAMAEADLRAAELTAKLRGPPRKPASLPEAYFREPEATEVVGVVGSEVEVSGAEPVFKIMVFEHLSMSEEAHPYSAAARRAEGLAGAYLIEGDGALENTVYPNVLCWSTCHACLKGELRAQAAPADGRAGPNLSDSERLMAQALSRPEPCPNHPSGELNMNCPMCRQWAKAQETGLNYATGVRPDEAPQREDTTFSSSSQDDSF